MPIFTKSNSKLRIWLFESIKKPRVRAYLLVLITTLIYHSVMLELYFSWWKNDYYYHGFAFPLISFFLVLKSRNKLKNTEIKGSLSGIVLVSLGVFIFLLDKYYFNILFLSALSMLIFLVGAILLAFGREYLRVLFFPVLLLIFMIPIPDFILKLFIFRLQLIASMIGATILQFLGVPVLRDGIYLQLPSLLIKVDETCSSMHSLIALSSASCVMAYLMADSIGKRVIIIASSIPLAILANGLRLVLVILLGLWMGEKVFQSYFHPFSGKLLFSCALFVLILETILLDRRYRSLKKILSSMRLSPSERESLRLKFKQFKSLWTKERTE